jgi:hypothetical protein
VSGKPPKPRTAFAESEPPPAKAVRSSLHHTLHDIIMYLSDFKAFHTLAVDDLRPPAKRQNFLARPCKSRRATYNLVIEVRFNLHTGRTQKHEAGWRSGAMSEWTPSTDSRDVYGALAAHQRTEPWRWQGHLIELQRWSDIFAFTFKLEIPHVSLAVTRLRASRYGHFHCGHNGFGLKGEIALNARYLDGSRPPWEILGTLLHELLHAWQQSHGAPGKSNYHNVEFRRKAREFGLVIDQRGVTNYEPESPFMTLLREHRIDLPEMPEPPAEPLYQGSSKLKKWSCGCTNVRVAKAVFRARCLLCGNEFTYVDRR